MIFTLFWRSPQNKIRERTNDTHKNDIEGAHQQQRRLKVTTTKTTTPLLAVAREGPISSSGIVGSSSIIMKLFGSSNRQQQDYRPVVEAEKENEHPTSSIGMFESVRFMAAGMMKHKRSGLNRYDSMEDKDNKHTTTKKPLPSSYPGVNRSSSTEKTGVLTFATSISESLSEEFSNAFHHTLSYFDPTTQQQHPRHDSPTATEGSIEFATVDNDTEDDDYGDFANTAAMMTTSLAALETLHQQEQPDDDDLEEACPQLTASNDSSTMTEEQPKGPTTKPTVFSLHPSAGRPLDDNNNKAEQSEANLLVQDLNQVEQEYKTIAQHIRAVDRALTTAKTSLEQSRSEETAAIVKESRSAAGPTPLEKTTRMDGMNQRSSSSSHSMGEVGKLEDIELKFDVPETRKDKEQETQEPNYHDYRGNGGTPLVRDQSIKGQMNLKPVVHVPLQQPKSTSDIRGYPRPQASSSSSLVASPLHSVFSSATSHATGAGSREMSLLDADDEDDDNASYTTYGGDGSVTYFGGKEVTPRSVYTTQSEFADDDTIAVLGAAVSHVLSCSSYEPQQYSVEDYREESVTPQATAGDELFRRFFGCGG